MKKLLLITFIALFSFNTFAQGGTSCTATNITANGTLTCATFPSTSTYLSGCQSSKTGIKAAWYKYTATTNGEITVSSNLTANNGTTYIKDTRVSIFEGAVCGTLTCIDYDDDISGTNLLTELTFPVAAGKTYYIQWDNYWLTAATNPSLGFQFTFNFNAVSCIRSGAFDFYLPDTYTTTSAKLYWNQAIGVPSNYDVDWSTTFTTAAGSGTIVPVTAGNATYAVGTVTNIPASSNFRYYVRSNCGGSQSGWQGPNFGYLAKTLPYSNTFESVANNYTDGFIGFSNFNSSATSTPANYADGGAGRAMYTYNSTTAISNLWAYSRAISLSAGETVTINFKTRLYSASTAAPMTLDLTVGSEQYFTFQTTPIQTFNITDSSVYTQQTATWTAPTAGIYYFGFNNNSPVGAQTYLFFDTLAFTSVLGTAEFLDSKFSVSPNPANDFVTISNADNISVKAISITDLNGRVVKQNTYSNVTNVQVNVSDLASGVYMMSISSDKGSVTKKIIKN